MCVAASVHKAAKHVSILSHGSCNLDPVCVAASVHEAAKEEQSLRAELRKQSIPGAQLQDVRNFFVSSFSSVLLSRVFS